MAPAGLVRDIILPSEGQQGVPGLLDRAGHRALLLGRKTGVFTGQNLAGVGDVTVHQLWVGEREILRRKTLLLFFGSAHDVIGREED